MEENLYRSLSKPLRYVSRIICTGRLIVTYTRFLLQVPANATHAIFQAPILRIRESFISQERQNHYAKIISDRDLLLKIMAHEVEKNRKPNISFIVLSKNDFVAFRSSQPGEV